MLKYLTEKYNETKWPFFLVTKLIHLGVFDKEEANRLYSEGKIRVRDGMHGKLIELIINKEENA